MYEIKIYKSKLKAFYLLLGSLGFVLTLLFLKDFSLKFTLEDFFPIFSILFFGLGMLLGLFQILDYRPQMIITKNGIWDRTSIKEELKWSQIKEIIPIKMYEETFLSVQTDDTYVVPRKKNKLFLKLNSLFGFHDQNINIGNLKINNVELLRLLYQAVDADEKKRQELILNFNPKEEQIDKRVIILKISKYVSISSLLLILTLFSYTFFWIVLIPVGLSAMYLKFNFDFLGNYKVEKYAKKIVYFGMANMLFVLGTYKTFEYKQIDLNEKIHSIKEKIKSHLN